MPPTSWRWPRKPSRAWQARSRRSCWSAWNRSMTTCEPPCSGRLHHAEERKAIALRLGGALYSFWFVRAYFSEGRDFLERALLRSDEVAAPVRAKALYAASQLHDVLALMIERRPSASRAWHCTGNAETPEALPPVSTCWQISPGDWGTSLRPARSGKSP